MTITAAEGMVLPGMPIFPDVFLCVILV